MTRTLRMAQPPDNNNWLELLLGGGFVSAVVVWLNSRRQAKIDLRNRQEEEKSAKETRYWNDVKAQVDWVKGEQTALRETIAQKEAFFGMQISHLNDTIDNQQKQIFEAEIAHREQIAAYQTKFYEQEIAHREEKLALLQKINDLESQIKALVAQTSANTLSIKEGHP